MPISLGADDIGGAQWPLPLEVTTPALSSHVPPLRRRFNQWLGGDHVDADLVDDLTLAVSEALENCCDHAFVAELVVGTMTLTARAVDTRLIVDVADDGLWQIPGTGPTGRGRGRAPPRPPFPRRGE